MDIPRIGYGAAYRPPQAGAGRTGEGAPEQPFGKPDKPLNAGAPGSAPPGGGKLPGAPLSEDEQKQVDKLKAIDTKVRQHEAAHQAAGGGLVGGASYTYTKGPDGRSYATGGEVPISAPAARSPEAAIRQAQQIKAAALAPADPSGQDLAVAAAATAQQAEAQRQLAAAKDPNAEAGPGGEGRGGERPPPGLPQDRQEGAASSGLPGAGAEAGAIPALGARGVAAYAAASQINGAPKYANPLFA